MCPRLNGLPPSAESPPLRGATVLTAKAIHQRAANAAKPRRYSTQRTRKVWREWKWGNPSRACPFSLNTFESINFLEVGVALEGAGGRFAALQCSKLAHVEMAVVDDLLHDHRLNAAQSLLDFQHVD